jgi:hypothetical protein
LINHIKIAIVGVNECFGEDDVLGDQGKYRSGAFCYSFEAVIIKVRKQKFLVNRPEAKA